MREYAEHAMISCMRYSIDFRLKVVKALDAGQSIRKVAKRFDISIQTVVNYKKLAKNNNLEPKRCGPKKPTKITPEDEKVIRQLVTQQPGITLKQLIEHISVPVAESTTSRTLKCLGITFKKRR